MDVVCRSYLGRQSAAAAIYFRKTTDPYSMTYTLIHYTISNAKEQDLPKTKWDVCSFQSVGSMSTKSGASLNVSNHALIPPCRTNALDVALPCAFK
jgi:hypothetical protein